MARRRKPDPFERQMGGVAGFVGLIIVAGFYFPGVRFVLSRFFVAFMIGLGVVLIVLIAWAIFRYRHKIQEEEYAAVYLSHKTSTDLPKSYASRHSAPDTSKTDAEADSQPDAFPDCEFWQDRLEGNVSDGFPQQGRWTSFTQDLLDALEWRRFEQLVTWYLQKTGFDAKRSRVGADGGVDIHIRKRGENRPFAYVQCKAWYAYKVGVKPIRELFGVMAADGIDVGYFVTTGGFTAEAIEFAKGRDMKLISGGYLLGKLNSLPEPERSELLQQITAGDYNTPTCPRCDLKMVKRIGGDGDFWGCSNFSRRPSCRQTFNLRTV